MAPRVGRNPPDASTNAQRKPIPDALKQTKTSEGVMQGVQPGVGTDSGGRTVTVACNLPNGIILRLYKWVDDRSVPPDKSTGERLKMAIPDGRVPPVRLHGWAVPFGKMPKFMIVPGAKGSQYALTTGVDREFWVKWLEANKESSLVTERMIYAMDSQHDATQEALNNGEKSGFEAIDPDAILKKDVPHNKHIKLETADLDAE